MVMSGIEDEVKSLEQFDDYYMIIRHPDGYVSLHKNNKQAFIDTLDQLYATGLIVGFVDNSRLQLSQWNYDLSGQPQGQYVVFILKSGLDVTNDLLDTAHQQHNRQHNN